MKNKGYGTTRTEDFENIKTRLAARLNITRTYLNIYPLEMTYDQVFLTLSNAQQL